MLSIVAGDIDSPAAARAAGDGPTCVFAADGVQAAIHCDHIAKGSAPGDAAAVATEGAAAGAADLAAGPPEDLADAAAAGFAAGAAAGLAAGATRTPPPRARAIGGESSSRNGSWDWASFASPAKRVAADAPTGACTGFLLCRTDVCFGTALDVGDFPARRALSAALVDRRAVAIECVS